MLKIWLFLQRCYEFFHLFHAALQFVRHGVKNAEDYDVMTGDENDSIIF